MVDNPYESPAALEKLASTAERSHSRWPWHLRLTMWTAFPLMVTIALVPPSSAALFLAIQEFDYDWSSALVNALVTLFAAALAWGMWIATKQEKLTAAWCVCASFLALALCGMGLITAALISLEQRDHLSEEKKREAVQGLVLFILVPTGGSLLASRSFALWAFQLKKNGSNHA